MDWAQALEHCKAEVLKTRPSETESVEAVFAVADAFMANVQLIADSLEKIAKAQEEQTKLALRQFR